MHVALGGISFARRGYPIILQHIEVLLVMAELPLEECRPLSPADDTAHGLHRRICEAMFRQFVKAFTRPSRFSFLMFRKFIHGVISCNSERKGDSQQLVPIPPKTLLS